MMTNSTEYVDYRLTNSVVFVDTAPPSAGALVACVSGPCLLAVNATCSASCLYYSWTGIADAEGPLRSARMIVSTSVSNAAFAVRLNDSVAVSASAGSYSDCSLTLVPGTRVRAQLLVTDLAGNTNTSTSFIVADSTQPAIPASGLFNGNTTGTHIVDYNRVSWLSVSFNAFPDAETGISSYDVSLVSSTGQVVGHAGNMYPAVVNHMMLSSDFVNLCGLYMWKVGAQNWAMCPHTYTTSATFVIDPYPPLNADAVVLTFLVRLQLLLMTPIASHSLSVCSWFMFFTTPFYSVLLSIHLFGKKRE
jgi:hypothetical protein